MLEKIHINNICLKSKDYNSIIADLALVELFKWKNYGLHNRTTHKAIQCVRATHIGRDVEMLEINLKHRRSLKDRLRHSWKPSFKRRQSWTKI